MKKIVLTLMAAFAFAACGGGDNGPGGTPFNPDDEKAKLEQVGLNFVNQINADDFTDLTDAIKALGDLPELPFLEGEEAEPGAGGGPLAAIIGSAMPQNLPLSPVLNGVAALTDMVYVSEYYATYTFTDGE